MLDVSFDGYCHPIAAEKLESAVRKCAGDPPSGHAWKLLISFSPSGLPYHRVELTTPRYRRACYFLDGDEGLADRICAWLNSYPLR